MQLVDDLRALVHLGRTAALAKNRAQMADVTIRLGTLVAEATAGRATPSSSRTDPPEDAGETSSAA